ncbi:MAG: nicotinate (nicotinamide) nucleotide adenylyltransferase [Urechidicola sp.]|nr:nicotinate (nicotinamide) nucleotide adenylyltransferase [Urechidicola sp.]
MNIGLFFGSFNPIHVGHLIIANHMAENSDLDKVWFVVTPHNPHKKKNTLLADHHRLQMVNIAVEEYPNLEVSNIEFDLPQPSYTVNTLIHIGEKFPQHQFSLIMGEDNLKSFHKWKNYETILENHQIYVYPRVANETAKPELLSHNHIHQIDAPIVELTSTSIRKGIAAQKNIRPLVPQNVWQYLDEMNFYK